MPDPTIDPITGKPIAPPTTPPKGDVSVKKEDWDALNKRLDSFERTTMNFNQQPSAPAAPQGPTLADQVKEIDTAIVEFNAKIDDAVTNGKPISSLMSERDTLAHRRTRLQIKYEDIDPAMNMGVDTINQISAEMTRGKMKYYDIVKDDVESSLAALPPDQRMNPQMRKAAYDIAVGKNIDSIMDAQKEEILRSASELPGNVPTGGNSRTQNADGTDTIPEASKILSPGAVAAMRSVGKTPDTYYQGLGYKGWDDFYEKKGKSYFGGDE